MQHEPGPNRSEPSVRTSALQDVVSARSATRRHATTTSPHTPKEVKQ